MSRVLSFRVKVTIFPVASSSSSSSSSSPSPPPPYYYYYYYYLFICVIVLCQSSCVFVQGVTKNGSWT